MSAHCHRARPSEVPAITMVPTVDTVTRSGRRTSEAMPSSRTAPPSITISAGSPDSDVRQHDGRVCGDDGQRAHGADLTVAWTSAPLVPKRATGGCVRVGDELDAVNEPVHRRGDAVETGFG